ncbi:NAD(P)H-dependent glycerol-3-phosphate dehydrogenase, partial [Nitrospira sp. BLG_2]|uniref:NAD(P)H-dependent glycerol-3-phosphate dehydrogenase n=1 Tax=Nitrospira sp. BLG_2 TaxID=3397507 RepID=UPI003B9AF4F8
MSTTINKIGVIGAGAWGTALAKHLADKGLEVLLWAYEHDVVNAINTSHENPVFLRDILLPPGLTATSSLIEAVSNRDGVLFAVPSHLTRSVLRQLAPCFSAPLPFVCATKGIEENTAKLMSHVMEDELPPSMHRSLMVLSGPSFASELSAGKPTAVCLAGPDEHLVRRFQSALMTPVFRVYADTDVIGVQLGGALKNVMALAAGVIDGLDLGLNARAALITRGL